MHAVTTFATGILLVSAALFAALFTAKLTRRLAVPAAVPFLVAAAIASDLFPSLALSTSLVVRIATVALIVILFDGGMDIGWARFRVAAWPIASLGTLGTFATAGGAAAFAHWAFGLDWTLAGLLGAAVAPTDPAVMFSVLGDREVGGRTGTILEAESGANDPVGISLTLGLVELATHHDASFWIVVREFVVQMAVGVAVGVVGGLLLGQAMQRLSLPNVGLYSLRALAAAGVVYGVATIAHGSGFLAVFVAGLVIGDVRAPFRAEMRVFHEALASLAEITVFVALGLTVVLGDLTARSWGQGLLLALALAVVIRPLAAGLLLVPTRLERGERAFVVWGGLKGAVPILLAAFAVERGIAGAAHVYELVFVVVLASVLVQGTSIPQAARVLGVSMRPVTRGTRAEADGGRR